MKYEYVNLHPDKISPPPPKKKNWIDALGRIKVFMNFLRKTTKHLITL